MAIIKLSKGGFETIPEGTYIFKVVKATYDEGFGKAVIELETEKGQKLTETYRLLDNNGEVNTKAHNAFSYFAKAVMNDFELEDLEVSDMVGKFIEADVVHNVVPSTKTPGATHTFANLGEKRPTDQTFGDTDSGVDLTDLLK